jgi:hypothetical protein
MSAKIIQLAKRREHVVTLKNNVAAVLSSIDAAERLLRPYSRFVVVQAIQTQLSRAQEEMEFELKKGRPSILPPPPH